EVLDLRSVDGSGGALRFVRVSARSLRLGVSGVLSHCTMLRQLVGEVTDLSVNGTEHPRRHRQPIGLLHHRRRSPDDRIRMGPGFLPGAHGRRDPRLPTTAGRTDRCGDRTRSATADRPRPRNRQRSDGEEGRRGTAEARILGVDASPEMLTAAARTLDPDRTELRRGRLEDPLPPGPFDLVMSTLAIHHLDGPGKADLFARIAEVLPAGGRFVLADLIVPTDPAEAVTPIDGVEDTPSTLDEQLDWLAEAGLV